MDLTGNRINGDPVRGVATGIRPWTPGKIGHNHAFALTKCLIQTFSFVHLLIELLPKNNSITVVKTG